MKELHLQGWVCYDEDGNISLKTDSSCYEESIQESVMYFFDVKEGYDDGHLGAERSIVPNTSLRIYATDKKCSLDEATGSVVANLYGDICSDIGYVGYSEYTITGFYCKEFTIGGHDLAKELDSYRGKYIHFVLEAKEE